jgi:hypothetical protein
MVYEFCYDMDFLRVASVMEFKFLWHDQALSNSWQICECLTNWQIWLGHSELRH